MRQVFLTALSVRKLRRLLDLNTRVRLGMLRRIIIVLSAALNLAGVIGLFTLPEDVPIALQRMGAIAIWFNREAILIGLFGISSLGFGWVVLQPIILKWLERRRVPPLKIDYPAEINSEGKYGVNKSSTMFITRNPPKDDPTFGRVVVTHYCLDITNKTSRTITNVSVQVHVVDNPLAFPLERRLTTRDGKSIFDIRPGYTEFIRLGFAHRYSREQVGEHVNICDVRAGPGNLHRTISGVSA